MNQLLLGVSVPFLVGAIVYFARRMRATPCMLITVPACMALSMTWAVVPDFPRLLGFIDLYNSLHADPRCNIFFWHYSIDRMETDSPWFAVGFVIVIGALLFAAWRELCIAEKRG